MRLKRAISSLILAIYLMASCGGMLSVILCHCTRSHHIETQHCCHCCHHSDGEGIKLPTNCCHHDHSTEIDLYNHERLSLTACEPAICATLPDIQRQISCTAEQAKLKHFDRRKIPLPESDFASIKGLRAPPVIA